MDKKTIKTEAKVGLFVLIGIILLFYMTFKISGHRKVAGEGKKYFAEFQDVSGIVEKGKVVIAGVDVGWVDKIELTENGKARLTLIVKKDIALKDNAKAYIKTYGFMGEKYVEISPGNSEKTLQSGDYIVHAFTEKSISDVANRISDAADEFKKVMKNLNISLTPDKNGKSKLFTIMDNFEKFSKNLEDLMGKNRGKLQEIVDNIENFSKNISKSSNNFNDLFAKADKTFKNLAQLSEHIKEGKGTVGKLIKDDSLYNNLNKTFANFNEISTKIKEGNGILGKLINDNKLYNDIENAVKGLKEISERISNGKGTIGKLINDDSVYKNLKETMANLKNITDKINNGKGSIGKMVSDDEMYKSIDNTLLRIQEAASGFSEQTPISTFGVVMGTLFSF